MRTIIAFTTFCFFSLKLFSQDTIVAMDKGQYIGKVLEVSATEITFQRMDAHGDGIVTRKRKYIAYIKYQNGTKEVINEKGKNFKSKTTRRDVAKMQKPKLHTPIDSTGYKKRRLSFSVNIISLLINERSLNVDYLYNYRHSLGIKIGQIYANQGVQDFRGFSSNLNENSNLLGIWKGMVATTNYKFYFFKQRRQYIGAEITYRSLHYSSQELLISQREGDNAGRNYFQRSEHTNEFGFDLQYGVHLLETNSFCNLELFESIGVRYRYRNYTTYASTHNAYFYEGDIQPVGKFNVTQVCPMFTIGLKLGYNAFFK